MLPRKCLNCGDPARCLCRYCIRTLTIGALLPVAATGLASLLTAIVHRLFP